MFTFLGVPPYVHKQDLGACSPLPFAGYIALHSNVLAVLHIIPTTNQKAMAAAWSITAIMHADLDEGKPAQPLN